MLDVNTITDDRQMRALTGLDLAAFCALAEPFARGCREEADARFTDQRPCKRKAGGGRKGVLASPQQKLLFVLYCLKTYPAFEVLGATFGLPYRKPRRSKKRPDTSLTDSQRTENATCARRRVKVEHAISGAKRLGCVAQTCRNKSAAFTDRLLALACGIWNWHLKKRKESI